MKKTARAIINPVGAICHQCGRRFVMSRTKAWRVASGRTKRVFCDPECYRAYKWGVGNPKWRGGRTVSKGYVYLYCPAHPSATRHGYVLEHRLVMEGVLGRLLKPDESAHHINGNTMDNRPENLQLMESEARHRKLHAKYRTREEGRFSGHLNGVTAFI